MAFAEHFPQILETATWIVQTASGRAPKGPVSERRLTKAEILKRFGWTEQQLESALGLGFPSASVRKATMTGGFVPLWRESLIVSWQAAVASLKLK